MNFSLIKLKKYLIANICNTKQFLTVITLGVLGCSDFKSERAALAGVFREGFLEEMAFLS